MLHDDIIYLVSHISLGRLEIDDGKIIVLEATLQAGEQPDGPPSRVQLGLHRIHSLQLGQQLLDLANGMTADEDPDGCVILDPFDADTRE